MAKSKSRTPYEFGAKARIAVTARKGLLTAVCTYRVNPPDAQLISNSLAR